MARQFWLYFPNVVDYPLVIFYNQECHIGTNVNDLSVIIIRIYIMLSFEFSSAQLRIILISHQSKLSYLKCENAKHENVSEFEFERFRRSSLGYYIHVTFTS